MQHYFHAPPGLFTLSNKSFLVLLCVLLIQMEIIGGLKPSPAPSPASDGLDLSIIY